MELRAREKEMARESGRGREWEREMDRENERAMAM